jgi:hypothetical protein
MNWTPQQLSQEVQYQAENDGFTSCFGSGWLQSFRWPFVNTTTENRPSSQRTGDPSKPDRDMHLYTCTGCEESFSQPEFRDWHVEKTTCQKSECRTTFDIRTQQMSSLQAKRSFDDSERTLVHATLSTGSTELSTPTPPPTPTETVLTIMSIQRIKAFVMVQKTPERIEQAPQTYSWEQFRGLDGAMDAMEDFRRKCASAQA